MKLSALAISLALACGTAHAKPFVWENATVYFLLTDRFNNANPANDLAYGRKADGAPLRGYMGGDLAGVTAKIKAGYFKELGSTRSGSRRRSNKSTPALMKEPAVHMASMATGPGISPASMPTWAPKPTCANWSTPRTRTASACCSTW